MNEIPMYTVCQPRCASRDAENQRIRCSGLGNPWDWAGDYEQKQARSGEGQEEAMDVAGSGPHGKARKVSFGELLSLLSILISLKKISVFLPMPLSSTRTGSQLYATFTRLSL